MIRIVTALAAEARPIVARLGLAGRGGGPFPRYAGDGVELAVSGVGSAAAAAAVGYLAGVGEGSPGGVGRPARRRAAAGWINLGVAGHRELPLGSVRLASKIVEVESGRTWYPPLAFAAPCPGAVVHTVSRVEREPVDDALYEMEAAGFYAGAGRFASAELVQALKVVSDNRLAPPERVTRRSVENLIESALPVLERLLEGTAALAAELAVRLAPPAGLDAFVERWRFTVTERRQLERLLRRLAVVAAEPVTPASLGAARSGGEALARLREML